MSEIAATRGSVGRLKKRVQKLEVSEQNDISLPLAQSDITGLSGYYAPSSPAPLTSPIQQSNVQGLTGYYRSTATALVQSDVTGLTNYYRPSNVALVQSDTTGLTGYYASSTTNTGDQNLFSTIAVSGQSDVVADSATDTLTLAAGSNITLTTNASTDTVTIAATGGSGDTGIQYLASTILAANTASITFSGLASATYLGFLIYAQSGTDDGSARELYCQLNNDSTTANYSGIIVRSDGTTQSTYAANAAGMCMGVAPASGLMSDYHLKLDKGTTGEYGTLSGSYAEGNTANGTTGFVGSRWTNTTALIDKILIKPGTGNLPQNSIIRIYGLKLS